VKALPKSRQHDVRAVEKFLQEARILARLDHPGIVHVAGVGRFPGGGYFIAMEFIDGVDLQKRLSRSPLPLAEAARIVRDAAAAIDYAHQQGIVHGDLKPANVIQDATGRDVVTDFGLAQFVAGARRPPQWIIGGTRGYIAPEVLQHGTPPTPAADVYGLGALLFALTTGGVPGSGALPTNGASPLHSLLSHCMATAPADRFPRASDVATALDIMLSESFRSHPLDGEC
jgi:serine/threonine-protein kinase